MGTRSAGLRRADLLMVGLGGLATVCAAYGSVRFNLRLSLGAVLAIAFFLATVLVFIRVPHVGVAFTIGLFVAIPALKVFVASWLGSVKDLETAAIAVAAIYLAVWERRRVDSGVAALVALLLGLYVIDAEGGHGVAWAQGVRLVGEPLLLLLTGMLLPQPKRVLRWAVGGLVAGGCAIAFYGLVQQVVGQYALVGWGYAFGDQVRTINGLLRSFGTFDDPFAYAAFLLFAVAAVAFGRRRSLSSAAALLLLSAGLAVSFVRTAVLVLVAFGGLYLARRRHATVGVLLVAATGVAGVVALTTSARGTEQRTFAVPSGPTGAVTSTGANTVNVILNGRLSAWRAAVGDNPANWVFGRGVGKVGTAADRARYTVAPPSQGSGMAPASAVDSGYLATVADVGILGLVPLLILLGRLFALGLAAGRRGSSSGWLAMALVTALVLDAVTRASLTGFPTASLGMLVVGVALAAARVEVDGEPRHPSLLPTPGLASRSWG